MQSYLHNVKRMSVQRIYYVFENDDDDDHGNNLFIWITQLLTDNVFKYTQMRPKGKEGKWLLKL